MKRNIKIKLNNNNVAIARACIIEKKKDFEIDVSIITAVDIRKSKTLQTASGDFGIVIYNELGFGFLISWKEFENLQNELKIDEKNYEKFLDNFINHFSDCVLNMVEKYE